MKIGDKIRQLRKTKNMTLAQLSELSQVALATLSRIENGKMTGTLESHMAVAKALGISLPELYGDTAAESKNVVVQLKKERSDVFLHPDKASYEVLTTSVLNKKMMPVMLKIDPDGKTSIEQAKQGTEKFVYVIKGSVEVNIEDAKYALSGNDSLYFDAGLKHYIRNIGKDEARMVVVTTPPML